MGRIGKKVQGIKSIIGRHKIDRGEVKNSIGNGKAKELMCMTHSHELGGKSCWGVGARQRGIKGRKKWDNCNSIINKIYLKIKMTKIPTQKKSVCILFVYYLLHQNI